MLCKLSDHSSHSTLHQNLFVSIFTHVDIFNLRKKVHPGFKLSNCVLWRKIKISLRNYVRYEKRKYTRTLGSAVASVVQIRNLLSNRDA